MFRIRFLIFILLYACLSGTCSLYCQTIESFSADFTRTVEKKGTIEITGGRLYFKAPDKMIMDINTPVHQYMLFRENLMIIYYPEEKKAYRFLISEQSPVQFATTFIGFVKEDFGLSESGFTLTEEKFENDTLNTTWLSPDVLKKTIRIAYITLKKDKSKTLSMYAPDKTLLIDIQYTEYIEINSLLFPCKINLSRQNGKETENEKISYSRMRLNEPLDIDPDTFSIPEDAEVKEYIW